MYWTKSKSYSAIQGTMKSTLKEKFLKNWFVIGIVFVIMLARLKPDIGLKGGCLIVKFKTKLYTAI